MVQNSCWVLVKGVLGDSLLCVVAFSAVPATSIGVVGWVLHMLLLTTGGISSSGSAWQVIAMLVEDMDISGISFSGVVPKYQRVDAGCK